MVPSLPIFWLLYVLYRAATRGGSGAAPSSAPRGPIGQALQRPVSVSGVAVIVWIGGSLVVAIAWTNFDAAPWMASAFIAVAAIALFPWLIVRYVLVPRGRYKLAYTLTRAALWVWRWDPHGGPALEAALALWSRRRPPTPQELEWVEARLVHRAGRQLRGAGIAATGAIAVLRGNGGEARGLFDSLDALDPRAATRPARVVAARVLIQRAAIADEWGVVADLAAKYRSLTRLAPLYARIAHVHLERLQRPARVSAMRLWLLWLLAPRWKRTFPFVRAAAALARAGQPSVVIAEPAWPWSASPPFDEALRRHAALALAADGPPRSRAWVAAAHAWSRVLEDDPAAERVLARAAAKGVADPRDTLRAFGGAFTVDLAFEALRHGVGAEELKQGGAAGARVAHLLEEQFFRDLDFRCRAIAQVTGIGPHAEPIERWKEFEAIRRIEALAGLRLGDAFRRGAFEIVHQPLSAMGVRLFNDYKEKALANAIFRWLGERAEACRALELAALYQGNAALGF